MKDTSFDRDMPRNHSFDFDDEFPLEELYEDVDFQFDLKGNDSESILQSLAKKVVIKSALRKYYDKVKERFQSPKTIRELLLERKQKLEKRIKAPLPFLRNSDKIAFTLGITVLCITEFVMLKYPEMMYVWYTFLVFPLLAARWYLYHKSKYQYFLLDFCYYAQMMLLFNIFFLSHSPQFFQLVFAVSNGPLLVGIVAWRNSLVFHDLDKLTSVFIHLFPALVTWCMRWYPFGGHFENVCIDKSCSLSMYNTFALSFVSYTIWQIMYLLKTEVIDKERLSGDEELMTSAKWMSEYRPHPLWNWYVKRFKVQVKHAPYILAATQYIYTFLTLIPILLIYKYFFLHCLYLGVITLVCVWNGSCFYFEIFAEQYQKRLAKSLESTKKKVEAAVEAESSTPSQQTQSVTQ